MPGRGTGHDEPVIATPGEPDEPHTTEPPTTVPPTDRVDTELGQFLQVAIPAGTEPPQVNYYPDGPDGAMIGYGVGSGDDLLIDY